MDSGQSGLWRLSAAELADGYSRGDFTPEEVTDAVLARNAQVGAAINALVTLDPDAARAQARASAMRWRSGSTKGPLDGVPITVKDNINVAGLRTTWGSRLYAQFVPAVDELPVARLRDAGMVILGKSNVPEFTLSGYTDNLLFGVTRNPWDLRLTPGGSSGGAVAAVASGVAPVALGTDGGGSIRRPASHAGIVGLKPSRGRVPRADGLPQILLDFEVAGPMARTTRDVVILMQAIAAPDARDPSSSEFAARPWTLPPSRRCRILYVPRFGANPVDARIEASVARAARTLAGLGHDVTEGQVPFDADAFNAVWPVVSQAGLAALLRRMPGWRGKVAPAFAEMADAGEALTAVALFDALAEIARMRTRVSETFAAYDAMMTPTTAALPWPALEAFPQRIEGRDVGSRGHAVFTAFANASGCPAISVPCAPSEAGLPIGFQLVGPPGGDERLCALAQAYETAEPWTRRWPAL